MECPKCSRYSPPDPETGYDVDELCPDCIAEIETSQGDVEPDWDDCNSDPNWDEEDEEYFKFGTRYPGQ